MANRCQQSTLNCMRKLNDLHIRKYQRDRLAPQTEATIKVNLAVLLVLQGRRDQALILLNEVYQNRHCFIEFMQSRIYFLLMVSISQNRSSIWFSRILWKCFKSIGITFWDPPNLEARNQIGSPYSNTSTLKCLW